MELLEKMGEIQSLLEWIGVPYSGSGVSSSAMAMDKEISNNLYRTTDLRVPQFVVLSKNSSRGSIKIPAVVKPADGGSSVGISVLKSKLDGRPALKKAFNESDRVMVQE